MRLAESVSQTFLMVDYSKADRLKGLLMDWADWYRGDYGPKLGFDSKSAGIGLGHDDWESVLGKEQARICKVINTAIDDLPGEQSCAIHHRYMAAVYRGRDYVGSLERAHDRLMVVLPQKNVII